ncbi:hypothetical protein PEX2_052280 [Penicillium expansum]|uniref:HAT C-terminal dimerisation domain-containing protein n=1 Tax=Penicillium expansum TaxID=27334 RepID=A0A0A2J3G6_PENEN|nr:hypothetical protein PEX2_052280 [Penicillium expansum]KGO49341.1 hypothetical protein PEX2_052280 [Penicillium expansum]
MAVTGYFLDYNWEYREVLLGFEPLSGTHSGLNLTEVLIRLLQQHDITDRVLAITTDNASNNNTLVNFINKAIQSLELSNSSTIIRVPCIAHVIQLSLKDLLGQLKANPKNEMAEMELSESRIQSLRVTQQERKIIDTLNKIRSLAVYIYSGPQRREAFYNLQTEEPKLVPIQDVKTRWNSTFLMLRRAKRLQSTFDELVPQLSITGQYDELSQYLNSGTVRSGPRIFWKEHQHKFPALASLARDVLSIPATGAGVERLFNSARDICHYRRGSLNPTTIQDLMIFMCTSRLDFEDEHRAMSNEYLSCEEIQAASEERDTQASGFDPISDDEEGGEGGSTQIRCTDQAPSERSQGKRRLSVRSTPEEVNGDDDEDARVLPLPDIQQCHEFLLFVTFDYPRKDTLDFHDSNAKRANVLSARPPLQQYIPHDYTNKEFLNSEL